jgi:hypothetical protein
MVKIQKTLTENILLHSSFRVKKSSNINRKTLVFTGATLYITIS